MRSEPHNAERSPIAAAFVAAVVAFRKFAGAEVDIFGVHLVLLAAHELQKGVVSRCFDHWCLDELVEGHLVLR